MNNNKFIPYYIENRLYNDNFTLFELVNDLTIINQSTTNNLTVNNVVLVPGQEFNTGGLQGEFNHQQFNCHFSATDIVNNNAVVLLKRYPQLIKQ